MNLLQPFVAGVLALGLCGAGMPQGRPRPPEKPVPDVRPTPTAGGQKEIDRLKKEIQGFWRMTDLHDPQFPPAPRLAEAYCLVHGDHLALEVHVDWVDDRPVLVKRIFDSGMYRYEIFEASRLEMRTLISAVAEPSGLVMFRGAGFTRRYRIEIAGDQMTWLRDDGQRTVFRRMAGTQTRRDIFGRPIPEPEETPAGGTGGVKKDERR